MSLTPGTRLGPYEIAAQIGEGGMGQVYRGTDTTLGRQVAIKILPDAFASDPERLARFEREARTLASLNHPHIAAIYGFEKSGGTHALVMELVEGPTLADIIARSGLLAMGSGQNSGLSEGPGPKAQSRRGLPLDEALPIARQIAEALEAAHEQGIIHRDLKPANIKVRPDGAVKVLDFGLAKLNDSNVPNVSNRPNVSQAPTITTPAMTQAGMILGTAAYMSPEQARGKPVDRRADIWAFGAVLFEMLTGKRAFEGDDVSDTLANVLKVEPAWDALPSGLSPTLAVYLKRCLHKDWKQRLGDMHDVRLALDGAFETPVPYGGPAHQAEVAAAVARAHRNLMRRRVWPAAVGLLTVVLAVVGWSLRPPSPPPVVRFSVPLPDMQNFNIGRGGMAISPDGTQLVYIANQRLYRRAIANLDNQSIDGTDLVGFSAQTAFSPDGLAIAFYSRDSTIKRVSVAGGTLVTLCRPPAGFVGGLRWEADGVVVGGRGGIWRCPVNGGEPQQLVALEAGQVALSPRVVQGGDALLFQLSQQTEDADFVPDGPIVVQSLRSDTRVTVVERGSNPQYLATGHLLYAVGGTVYAAAFDPERPGMTTGARAVLEGVRRGREVAHFKVSENGSLVYIPGPATTMLGRSQLAVATPGGNVTRLPVPEGQYSHPRVSRDGNRLALEVGEAQVANVWVYEMRGATALRRLTFGGSNHFPVVAANGDLVAYQSDREGDQAIFVQRFDGTGAAERLTKPESGVSHVPESWSPDGRHLAFASLKDGRYTEWTLSVEDKSPTPLGELESAQLPQAVFSPDGRWIAHAYTQMDGGLPQPDRGVYLQPFPATGERYKLPNVRLDFHPVWSRDGRSLFYLPFAAGRMVAVSVTTRPAMAFGSPTELAPALLHVTSDQARPYDILPDGRFIGFVEEGGEASAAPAEMRVVLNWSEELKRLVPAD